MSESLKSRLLRLLYNFFPAYRRCGARATYVSADLHTVRIKLPLRLSNKSHQGGIWGGSLYGALDPVYTIMLSNILGREYVVLDKSAMIEFLKQGKTTLFGEFVLSKDEIEAIKESCSKDGKAIRKYSTRLSDSEGKVYITAIKEIHIRKRRSKLKDKIN